MPLADRLSQVVLIHLLECLSSESLGRYAAKPKMRVQRFENANIALDFIKSRGIQMTNIGAEDVVDGNRKIILGLIWTLILRFTINDISEEGMTAKEGLLLWCQRKTACYDEVDVRDFSASWNDGLAFCALLDIHRPDLIDYDALDKSDHRGNMQLAFDIAHKEIGIPKLLDVEDVCDVAKPDERSLMTYIAYWFHAFSQMEKVENAGRRVEKFVNNMRGAWDMQSAYERRMAALLKVIREQMEKWQQAKFEGTYADVKAQATDFAAYKRGLKREWVAERSELATLLGNIKTKLGTYRLRPYEPPAELGQELLDLEWANLTKAEMVRGQLINETIREYVFTPARRNHTATNARANSPVTASRTPYESPSPTRPTTLPSRSTPSSSPFRAWKATWKTNYTTCGSCPTTSHPWTPSSRPSRRSTPSAKKPTSKKTTSPPTRTTSSATSSRCPSPPCPRSSPSSRTRWSRAT